MSDYIDRKTAIDALGKVSFKGWETAVEIIDKVPSANVKRVKLYESRGDKCCCNCRRCLRVEEKGHINTYCEVDGHWIGHVECFDSWCRHWAKEKI